MIDTPTTGWKWSISPPEVLLAKNGFILKQYDVHSDSNSYRLAHNVEELRDALSDWADEVCASIKLSVERQIEKVLPKE